MKQVFLSVDCRDFGTDEFVTNPEARLPLALLLDCSSSMEGEKLHR